MKHELKSIRVYELRPEAKGCRILVDRLWPRGVRKESLGSFLWAKEITPSNELRKWFGHDPERFEEFVDRYMEELANNPYAGEFEKEVTAMLKEQDVLLLFAARSKTVNHAVVLKEWLLGRTGN